MTDRMPANYDTQARYQAHTQAPDGTNVSMDTVDSIAAAADATLGLDANRKITYSTDN